MAIDWTQTMIGSLRNGEAGATAPEPSVVASLAGAGAACVGIGLALLLSLSRGAATTIQDITSLAGLLLAHVLAVLLLQRFGARFRVLSVVAGGFAPLFSWSGGMPHSVVAAIGMAIFFNGVGGALRQRRVEIAGRVLAALALLAVLLAHPAASLPILTALVPVLVRLAWLQDHSSAKEQDQVAPEIARLQALLAAARHEQSRIIRVTDIVGRIDHAASGGTSPSAPGIEPAEDSLVETTLIADRVILLEALSRAIKGGASSRGLILRMRSAPAGIGYPSPPRFATLRAAVTPLPGVEGRAIVTIDAMAPHAESREGLQRDSGGIERALHDSVAPFNAGLGFLDMIADPMLAPRDIATYRDFAAEAHKAIADAHRNSVLVGRLLQLARAGTEPVRATVRVQPGRLLTDGVRALHLRKAIEIGQIRIEAGSDLPAADIDPLAGRLAIEAMLRFAGAATRADIALRAEGADLVITCTRHGGADIASSDALQVEIEAAAAAAGGISFEAGDGDMRMLRFRQVLLSSAGQGKPEAAANVGAQGLKLAS